MKKNFFTWLSNSIVDVSWSCMQLLSVYLLLSKHDWEMGRLLPVEELKNLSGFVINGLWYGHTH